MSDTSQRTVDPVHDEPAAWRGLPAAVLKYVEARGVLARIEAQEALSHVVWAVALGVIAGILALGTWLLIVPALIWLACKGLGWNFPLTLLIVGGVHAICVAVCVKMMLRRLRSAAWFAETLEQFKKDRTWILHHSGKS